MVEIKRFCDKCKEQINEDEGYIYLDGRLYFTEGTKRGTGLHVNRDFCETCGNNLLFAIYGTEARDVLLSETGKTMPLCQGE